MRKYLFAMFLAIITFLSLGSHALAACSAPTVGSNLVLRFPSAQGVWVGAASSIRAEDTASTALNTAGVLYYDTDSNDLKLCDGTDWITLGAGGGGGGGSATLAGLSDVSVTGATNGQALVFNSSTNMWEPLTISGGISTPSATGMAWLSSTNISLTDSIWTNVPLSSGNSNLNGVTHSTTVNPARMTVSKTGTYLVSYTLGGGIRVAGAGTNLGRLAVNGVNIAAPAVQQSNSATFATELSNSVILSLTAGDYVTVQAYANVPGNTVISATLILFEIGGSGGGAGSETLSNLTDVDVTGATAGQSLVFNGTQWEAKSISGGGSFELGTPITVNTPSQAFVNTCNATTNPSVVIPKTGYYHIKNLLRGYVYSGAVVHVTMNLINSGGAVVYAANTGTARAVSHYITIDSTDIVNLPAGTYTMNVVIDNGSGNCAGANWDRLISASFTFREILGGGSGSGADSLADLTDVDVTGATNGQALVFNSATNTWIPGSVSVPSGAEYAFYAGGLPTLLSGNATAFPSLLFNIGNAFNNATGAFTAPVDGLYSFSFTTLFAQTGVNGSVTITQNGIGTVHSYSNNGENNSVSASAVLNLAAGDVIRLYYSTGTPFVGNNAWHAFSGYKIGGSGSGGSGADTLAALTDVDVTGATNGQALVFNSSTNTWAPAEISLNGVQVGFVARGAVSVLPSSNWASVTMPTIVNQVGGNNYNASTGKFTVPQDGFYQFNASLYVSLNNILRTGVVVQRQNAGLDTNPICLGLTASPYTGGTSFAGSGTCSGMAYLTAGEIVEIKGYNDVGGALAGTYNTFSGVLLNSGSSGSSGSETLADLTDVDVTDATAGQSLVFNGTTWEANTVSGSDATPIAFTATANGGANQTVSPGVAARVNLSIVKFDIGNDFDTTTSRFTPKIAGTYIVNGRIGCATVSGYCLAYIVKNGSTYAEGARNSSSGNDQGGTVTAIVNMNGTTDYLELHGYTSGTTFLSDPNFTYFGAALINGGSSGGGSGSETLAGLTDVDVTGATSGQSLVFNGTTWGPGTSPINGDGIVTVSVNRNAVNQTVTAGTLTNIDWTTKEFDTHNSFDLSTDRFQPTIAGYYLISAQAHCNGFGGTSCQVRLFKNGVQTLMGYQHTANAMPNVTSIIYMNGSTDYLVTQVLAEGSNSIYGDKMITFFNATLMGSGGGSGGSTALAALTDVDTSGATNGQSLVFNSTTSTWEPQTITGSGGTTVAFRGAFSVPSRATGTIDQTNYTQEYNTGSAFNATTGVFTAPQDGIYLFTGYLHAIMPVDGQLYCAFKKNGSLASYCSRFSVSNSTNPMSSGSTTLSLVAGDTVVMTSGVYMVSGTASNFMGNFSGVLLNGAGGSGGSGVEALSALTDVDTTGVTEGQSLAYNSTTSMWEPRTITGGGGTSNPVAFSVHRNGTAQTVTANVENNLVWTSKVFDTNNAFNLSTGRFQPNVAGYYQVNLSVYCDSSLSSQCVASINKNGVRTLDAAAYSQYGMPSASGVLYLNGTTDYVTATVLPYGGTNINGSSGYTNFNGTLITNDTASITGGKFVDGTNAANAVYTTGNVGVGTATPTLQLSVSRTTPASVDGPNATKSYPIATFGAQSGAYRGLEIGAPTDNVTSPVYLKVTGTSSRFAVLNENDVENFTILGSGNVGIGRPAPAYKLDVNGAINASSVLINGVPVASSTDTYWSNAGSGVIQYSGGRVGIGTSSPLGRLHVAEGAARNEVFLTSTGEHVFLNMDSAHSNIFLPRIRMLRAGTHFGDIGLERASNGYVENQMVLGTVSNIPVTIKTNETSRLTVLGTGEVGIGTTTPRAKLDVTGGALVVGAMGPNGNLSNTTAGVHANDSGYIWAARGGGSTVLYLQQLAAGTGPLVSFISQSANVGSINTDGTGTSYNTTSDARLKENLTQTERGLDALMRIDVQDFNFISDAAKNRVQGFIAQQLNTVYPEAVTVGGDTIDKPWNVDYGRLTPLIVKSIQDLKAKNDALELENEQLNRKVDNMQLQMDAMKAAIEKLQAAQ